MRKLSLLLVLALLSVLLVAATAQASVLSGAPQSLSALLADPEEEDEAEEDETGDEDEESEDPAEEAEIEREICEEDPELCEEEESEQSQGKGKKNDRCLLKKASAIVTANPGKGKLRLTVRYKTLKPATVNVEASLRGPKGVLSLGNELSRFRRSGVYRDTFQLPDKKMRKALAARDFQVELQALDTPASCRVELTAHRDGAKKLIWS